MLQHSYFSIAQNFQGISQAGRIAKYFTENEVFLYHNQIRSWFREALFSESFLKEVAKFPGVPTRDIIQASLSKMKNVIFTSTL